MDAIRYADEIVEPTTAEFEADPLSTRRAFLACVVTFHMIDYIVRPAEPGARREAFRRESEAFATVDRVAHAMKHVSTGHPRKHLHQPLSAEQVIQRPPAYWDVSGAWDLSRWDDPIGGITIAGEHQRDILEDVKAAAAFLRTQANLLAEESTDLSPS
jgi:hypothetical protein